MSPCSPNLFLFFFGAFFPIRRPRRGSAGAGLEEEKAGMRDSSRINPRCGVNQPPWMGWELPSPLPGLFQSWSQLGSGVPCGKKGVCGVFLGEGSQNLPFPGSGGASSTSRGGCVEPHRMEGEKNQDNPQAGGVETGKRGYSPAGG